MKPLSILLLFFLTLTANCQNNNLCVGHYWTEDEANKVMKQFAGEWHDKASWEKRAEVIRHGIREGMQLDKMPAIKGNLK